MFILYSLSPQLEQNSMKTGFFSHSLLNLHGLSPEKTVSMSIFKTERHAQFNVLKYTYIECNLLNKFWYRVNICCEWEWERTKIHELFFYTWIFVILKTKMVNMIFLIQCGGVSQFGKYHILRDYNQDFWQLWK